MSTEKKKAVPRNRSQAYKAENEDAESKFSFDPEQACLHLSSKDKELKKVIKAVGPYGLQVMHMQNCFESLLESIVYQQLTGKAAATIMGRVKAIYGDRFPEPEEVLKTDDETLRAAGLSRAKLAAMKDLALKTSEGLIPDINKLEKMSDEEIISLLTQVRGIGEWTVHMMLMFKLGRPDVLPINDYGVRKGFAKMYRLEDLPAPRKLLEHGEKWRPYRSVASWYLWRVLELK